MQGFPEEELKLMLAAGLGDEETKKIRARVVELPLENYEFSRAAQELTQSITGTRVAASALAQFGP